LDRRLGPELLRESIHTPFCVDELLTTCEERVAGRADFKVQLGFRRPRLPGCAARAADVDDVVLGVNAFFHNELL
jgi:hypothetical protein